MIIELIEQIKMIQEAMYLSQYSPRVDFLSDTIVLSFSILVDLIRK